MSITPHEIYNIYTIFSPLSSKLGIFRKASVDFKVYYDCHWYYQIYKGEKCI